MQPMGNFIMGVIVRDADGNEITVASGCDLNVSDNPAKRITENDIKEAIKKEIDENKCLLHNKITPL